MRKVVEPTRCSDVHERNCSGILLNGCPNQMGGVSVTSPCKSQSFLLNGLEHNTVIGTQPVTDVFQGMAVLPNRNQRELLVVDVG